MSLCLALHSNAEKHNMHIKDKPPWLHTDEILSRFGPDKKVQKYCKFITEGIDAEIDSFFKKLTLLPILGCEAFTKTISEKYLKNETISSKFPNKNI